MQMGFYFDQAACIGCGECEFICKSEHELDTAVSWRRVITTEENDLVENLSYSCYHCARPACESACPVDAIYKREQDGTVLIDSNKCAEARRNSECTGTPCKDACSYDIPQITAGQMESMSKCDFCLDRLETGESPRCVIICAMEALDAGPMDELIAKYGDGKKALGFEYFEDIGPSVIFKSEVD